MSYKVLVFEPKKDNDPSGLVLWKAQMFPPTDYQSVGVTLLNDNIEVNNRRTSDEWEILLTENGFKYELNYDHEFCKEFIIFDTSCVAFSFQIFACDITSADYKVLVTGEDIIHLLFTLSLQKSGTIFPASLQKRINDASELLTLPTAPLTNMKMLSLLKVLQRLVDHCQSYEVDIKYYMEDR
jgi:hypothetical protein